MKPEWEVLCEALCITGESPLYDAERKILYYIDIHGRRLRRMDYGSGDIRDTVLPRQIGAAVLASDGTVLACMTDGIYRIGEDGSCRALFAPMRLAGMRFNDVKAGPDGALYGGTMDYGGQGAFYRIAPDGTVTELLSPVGSSNGLDWDLEKNLLYFNDTPTQETAVFDFSGGWIANRRVVRHFEEYEGEPDGMTLDAENKIWIALWGHGQLLRIDPATGKTLRKVQMPVSNVSCCAFAGDDGCDLIVTTGAHNTRLRNEPLAGALFRIRTDVPGRRVFRFGGPVF